MPVEMVLDPFTRSAAAGVLPRRRKSGGDGRYAGRGLREWLSALPGQPGFVVEEVEGPPEPRQVERGVAWGRSIARKVQTRLEAGRQLLSAR